MPINLVHGLWAVKSPVCSTSRGNLGSKSMAKSSGELWERVRDGLDPHQSDCQRQRGTAPCVLFSWFPAESQHSREDPSDPGTVLSSSHHVSRTLSQCSIRRLVAGPTMAPMYLSAETGTWLGVTNPASVVAVTKTAAMASSGWEDPALEVLLVIALLGLDDAEQAARSRRDLALPGPFLQEESSRRQS